MLKSLIVAADSATPDYIFKHLELFPTLNRMVRNGASASYSSYVQKGFDGSYSSEQNWASIYTGLTPQEHGITYKNVRGEIRRPEMRDFDQLQPFWQQLNDNGLSVGLWAADNCVSPVPIKGYAVSCKYGIIDTPCENRESPRQIQLCEQDKNIAKFLDGAPIPRLYPKTLLQQGYTFEQLKNDPDFAEEAVSKYHFQDALPNFEAELDYWFGAMSKTQRECPVDVLYLFTPSTDLIAHCCMCCDDNNVLIEAYQILDRYIGEFLKEFKPEITVFFSDHGQQNFKDLIKCKDPQVKREAFTAKDEVLWLKNGYIAFEAYNGALLFTAHALKGTFIAAGTGIRHTSVEEMRTLDIYPTLHEIFGIKVLQNRQGFVVDIFDKYLINANKLLKLDQVKRKSIALIQTNTPSVTDIIINELYISNRFSDITLVGEPRYKEIFLGNPRITDFVNFEQFSATQFDEVYCGFYNENSKNMRYIRI